MRPNLAVLRSAVGALLTETGTLQRFETVVIDGLTEHVWVDQFSTPCLVRPEGGITYVEVGGVERPAVHYDVTLPADSDVQVGDRLVLDDVPGDAVLSGAIITLTDVPLDSWQVSRDCKGKRG